MTLQQAILLALQASILMTVFSFGLRAALALTSAFALRPSVEVVLLALAVSPIPPLLPGREEKAGGHASFGLGLMVIVGLLIGIPYQVWQKRRIAT